MSNIYIAQSSLNMHIGPIILTEYVFETFLYSQ